MVYHLQRILPMKRTPINMGCTHRVLLAQSRCMQVVPRLEVGRLDLVNRLRHLLAITVRHRLVRQQEEEAFRPEGTIYRRRLHHRKLQCHHRQMVFHHTLSDNRVNLDRIARIHSTPPLQNPPRICRRLHLPLSNRPLLRSSRHQWHRHRLRLHPCL